MPSQGWEVQREIDPLRNTRGRFFRFYFLLPSWNAWFKANDLKLVAANNRNFGKFYPIS
jgi:hypothetical protein